MSKHTPGPWHTQHDEWTKNSKGPFVEIRNTASKTFGYSPICRVRGDRRLVDRATMLANARLIAAAPDLLAALKAMVERDWTIATDKAARAAIAKAGGA